MNKKYALVDDEEPLTPDALDIAKKYSKLNDDGKDFIKNMVDLSINKYSVKIIPFSKE